MVRPDCIPLPLVFGAWSMCLPLQREKGVGLMCVCPWTGCTTC